MRIAVIREEDCVGCTKCLPSCPVDAIVGAAKFLHTVIASECIGCGLCLAPCPMDCIDMIEIPKAESQEERVKRAEKAKARYRSQQRRKIREQPLQLRFDIGESETQTKIKENIQQAFTRVEQRRKFLQTIRD